MKIISKYKDFYDYLVQDNDADLIYVRKIGFVNEYYDNLFNKTDIYIPYYSKYYGYMYTDYYTKNRMNANKKVIFFDRALNFFSIFAS